LVDVAMTAHRQKFDRALEAIEAKVIELFAMVAEDLPGATNALLSSNNEVPGVLAERQQVIHALYPQIEKQVHREILLQAPVAQSQKRSAVFDALTNPTNVTVEVA
jgi:phosphate uptake regulator